MNVKTFVLVSLAWKKENALNNFLEKISKIDEVTECYIITGEADFLHRREIVAGCPKIYGQLVQLLAPYTSVAAETGGDAAAST